MRFTLVVVGTAAYFGLAVLGWGGFTAFFSHLALIALAVVFFALAGAALFAGGNLSAGVREDRANRWVIVAFALIGLLDGFLPAWTDRKEFWTIDGDTTLAWRGCLRRGWCTARVAGLCARQSVQRVGGYPARTHAGHYWRPWRHSPSQLSGAARQLAGMGVAFRSGIGVLLTALLILPLLARIRAEEKLLRTQFGAEYNAYCARTSRLIPGLF